jgi:alpha-L-arabinofuranosidase
MIKCSKLMGKHVITETLPVATDANFGPLYYVAGKSGKGTTIFKAAVYNTTAPVPVSLQLEGYKKGAKATLTVLTGPEDPYGYNDPWTQINVVKEKTTILKAGENGTFSFSLPRLSVAVLETSGKGDCERKKMRMIR